MPTNNITPTVAATLADAVYGIRENMNVREGVARTLGMVDHSAGQHGPQPTGSYSMLDCFDLGGGGRIEGRSGWLLGSRKSGFSMVLPGKGTFAGHVAVVCRGTQTYQFDWGTNLNVGLATGPAGLPVHAGFARTYKSLEPGVGDALSAMGNPSDIHVVGHSLGGALASLFAMKFANERRANVHLYTFGAPRAGTSYFTAALRNGVSSDQIKRVYALADPVPMIPIFPFAHHIGGMKTNSGGQLISLDAHSMSKNYRPAVFQKDWNCLEQDGANVVDLKSVDYWVDMMSNSATTPLGAAYFYVLGKGLQALLKVIDVVLGSVVTIGATVIDRIAMALYRGVRLVGEIGEKISYWTRKLVEGMMRFLGRAVDTVADLTMAFLRYVLSLLFNAIAMMAIRAIDIML